MNQPRVNCRGAKTLFDGVFRRTIFFLVLLLGCQAKNDKGTVTPPEEKTGKCAEIDASTNPVGTSQLVVSVGSYEPCEVSGYIVGKRDTHVVQPGKDGKLYVNNVPAGEHDIVLYGTGQLITLDSKISVSELGVRLKKLKFSAGTKTEHSQLSLPKLGAINGVVKLVGATDFAGIDVYIPGTDVIGKTDATGAFSLSRVPVGEQNLYFEKDGYVRGQIEAIDVGEAATTTTPEVNLVVSTGSEGFVIAANGDSFYNSLTVPLLLGVSGDAVLMKISEDVNFLGATWTPIKTTTTYTFSSNGAKTLYVKFANANGLESSPYSATVSVNQTAPTLSATTDFAGGLKDITVTISPTTAVGISHMKVGLGAGFDTAEWITYSSTHVLGFGSGPVKVKLKDKTGYESETYSVALTYVPKLNERRAYLGATVVGTKAIFAGGLVKTNGSGQASKAVDIYDSTTKTWSSSSLEYSRYSCVATSAGTKALFTGESLYNTGTVEIYNSTTGVWTTASLSTARFSLAAASVGDIAFLGGGITPDSVKSNAVDIYNAATNVWSTATLSQARSKLAAVSVGGKILFAGGEASSPSAVVDIYDTTNSSWSTAALSEARYDLAAVSLGTKVYFAGGIADGSTRSTRVDIYDSQANTWTTTSLSGVAGSTAAAAVGNKIFFAGGGSDVGVYDVVSNTWSVAEPSSRRAGLAAVSIGDFVLFAGGYLNSLSSSSTGQDSSTAVDLFDATGALVSSLTANGN